MSQRWDKRLRMPKSEGGATICEKHDFIEANFRDPEMSWEVDQVVTQAKDDGKRMEARIQELGEEANNLEEALQEIEADRDRLAAELARVRRNHLRRMRREALEWADRMTWDVPSKDDVEWVRRNRPRLMRFAERCRAALASMGTK